jgi:hypothetical protein
MRVAHFCGGLLLAGCGSGEVAPARAPSELAVGAEFLAHCPADASELDVRAWSCDRLTAVETFVESASDRDVAQAIDGFAASFPANSPRRVDSVYAVGNARHTWVRLEGTTSRGEPVEAQMVAVAMGPSVRLVTCSSHGDVACGPVVAELVHGHD